MKLNNLKNKATLIICFITAITTFVTCNNANNKSQTIPVSSDNNYPEPGNSYNKNLIDTVDSGTWLQVIKGCQPGIYNYKVWTPRLPDGDLYIKCFEDSENIPLSANRIAIDSYQKVQNHNHFGCIGEQEFTILESQNGDYYDVRVEVWLKPSSKGRDKKICEQIYKMCGWQK